MELKAGGGIRTRWIRRSTLIRIATHARGDNSDIVGSSDADSVDDSSGYAYIEEASLSNPNTFKLLAWVLVHFVHLVADAKVDDPWKALLDHVLLDKWTTPSDWGFTFFVIEHGINQWKRLARYRQENNGKAMESNKEAAVKGLRYPEGIAGEAGKRRYNALKVYFYLNFFCNEIPEARRNMKILQQNVNEMVEQRKRSIDDAAGKIPGVCTPVAVPDEATNTQETAVVVSDVLHRVFYYLSL